MPETRFIEVPALSADPRVRDFSVCFGDQLLIIFVKNIAFTILLLFALVVYNQCFMTANFGRLSEFFFTAHKYRL